MAKKKQIKVWQGVVKAIVDGHSCLPQESQEIILALIRSGKVLARELTIQPDSDGSEVRYAIALFEGLEVGE